MLVKVWVPDPETGHHSTLDVRVAPDRMDNFTVGQLLVEVRKRSGRDDLITLFFDAFPPAPLIPLEPDGVLSQVARDGDLICCLPKGFKLTDTVSGQESAP